MVFQRKFFELLDIPRLVYPSLKSPDVLQTAHNVRTRLKEKSFMSYGRVWALLPDLFRKQMSDPELVPLFSFYSDDWKNKNLQDVARLLMENFAGGTWYPFKSEPIEVVGGMYLRAGIKGVWFADGQARALLVNARKRQPLSLEHQRFLARGVYEMYCIDDPNDPLPLIADISQKDDTSGRVFSARTWTTQEMMSLDEYEATLRVFLEALGIAGVSSTPINVENAMDMFRRKR